MSALSDLLVALEADDDPAARHAAWEELSRITRTFVRARMGRQDRSAQESMDVVNSILGSLAVDLRERRVVVEDEAHLRRYLKLLVGRKLTDLGRQRRADRRGGGRTPAPMGEGSNEGPWPADPRASAGAAARLHELEARAAALLEPDELAAWRLFVERRPWAEVGAAMGVSPDAARHRLARIRERLGASVEGPG